MTALSTHSIPGILKCDVAQIVYGHLIHLGCPMIHLGNLGCVLGLQLWSSLTLTTADLQEVNQQVGDLSVCSVSKLKKKKSPRCYMTLDMLLRLPHLSFLM